MRDPARDYLCSEVPTFWQWRDAGEVIAWQDGATITFRGELLTVLRRLAPQGLPPLGAVLLLLAATRDSWEVVSSELSLLSPVPLNDPQGLTREVLSGLERVSRLDAQLRASAEARAVIAETVFEHSPQRLSPQDSASVIQLLEAGLTDVLLEPHSFSAHVEEEVHTRRRFCELGALRSGLDKIDPQALKLRLATGLDALPAAASPALPEADQARAFLKSLDDDPELRGLARLARDLTAAVTLPRAMPDTEEMPIGGVSDITNRGPLDRLLLSELAHDDLVLAVRIAVNEAMYLRRERPPRAPVRRRAVLLDAGIRSWGVPRVFATSVALALAATSDRRTQCAVYRAQGRAAEPLTLTQREGLVRHLAALEPDIHPGAALAAFQKIVSEAGGMVEKVLVTTDDVLSDGEFQAALNASDLRPLYLISLCRNGRMRLIECNLRGTKLIREARLDLAELLEDRPQATVPLIDKNASGDLPMIFVADPFPLLLSHSIDDRNPLWLPDDERVLAITGDRRLMLWSGRQRGAQQISTSMPAGSLCWCSYDRENRIARALIGPRCGTVFHLLQIDLEQLQCESQRVNLPRNVDTFSGHNGAIFAFSSKPRVASQRVFVLSEATGEVIRELDMPEGMVSCGGRFFCSADRSHHFALGFDGQTAHLEAVFTEEQERQLPILVMMTEHPEVDGAIAITADGKVVYSATGEIRKVPHSLRPPVKAESCIWARGRVILSGGNDYCAVDLKTLSCERILHPARFHDVLTRNIIRIVNQRYRFISTYVDAEGVLTLVSAKQQHFGVVLDPASQMIRLKSRTPASSESGQAQGFRPCDVHNNANIAVGFKLFEARRPEGSRVFLDGRGLMHLKSSDAAIPEATLVLSDGALSGWCSDGRLWGKPYFIGDQPATADHEIFESVIRPFVERLR